MTNGGPNLGCREKYSLSKLLVNNIIQLFFKVNTSIFQSFVGTVTNIQSLMKYYFLKLFIIKKLKN